MAANTNKPPTKSEIYAKIVDDTGLFDLAHRDVLKLPGKVDGL